MIRSLNKSLLREWSSTQLKPVSKPICSSPSTYRCKRNALYSLSAPSPRHSSYFSLSVARIAGGNARYSTIPEREKVKTQTDVPLPSKSPSRKPKVDLRPAPKTLNQEPRNSTQPHATAAVAATQSSKAASFASPSTTTSASSSTTSTEKPIKSIQEDISEATKHGILTPPPKGASTVGKLWHNLKQLFWFYWRGVKMIFVTHRKQAIAIQRRVQLARAKDEDASMTRWETRFLRTYKMDILKLFPFILTVLILEEALPLVVLYIPGLLPSTCLLPSQRERIEAKRRIKQVAHMAAAKSELRRLKSQQQYDVALIKEKGLGYLSGDLPRAVSGILSRPTWGPIALQRRRIAKYLAYISEDDALLVKEGMGSRLNEEELAVALKERGLIVEPPAPQRMLERLQWWLTRADDDRTRVQLVLQAASDHADQSP